MKSKLDANDLYIKENIEKGKEYIKIIRSNNISY